MNKLQALLLAVAWLHTATASPILDVLESNDTISRRGTRKYLANWSASTISVVDAGHGSGVQVINNLGCESPRIVFLTVSDADKPVSFHH